MIASGIAMARFSRTHRIPTLVRNHTISDTILPHITDPHERRLLLAPFARASYGLKPLGHIALDLAEYVHFPSPLRRAPDFMLHANLAAFIDGRQYPFARDTLHEVAARIQRHDSYRRRRKGAVSMFDLGTTVTKLRQTPYLLERLAEDEVAPSTLAHALFAAVGPSDQIAAVRQRAAEYIGTHPEYARNTFNIALARSHLSLQPAPGEGTATLRVVGQSGQSTTYLTSGNRLHSALGSIRMIEALCGVSIHPAIPESWQQTTISSYRLFKRLHELASQQRIKLSTHTRPSEHGDGFEVTITVKAPGRPAYTATGSGTTRVHSYRKRADHQQSTTRAMCRDRRGARLAAQHAPSTRRNQRQQSRAQSQKFPVQHPPRTPVFTQSTTCSVRVSPRISVATRR
jgi:hypothetical protein